MCIVQISRLVFRHIMSDLFMLHTLYDWPRCVVLYEAIVSTNHQATCILCKTSFLSSAFFSNCIQPFPTVLTAYQEQ